MYGIDSKADVIFIEQEALLILITMRQGHSKSNDECLKHLKVNLITIKLAGGEHNLYDDYLCQKFMNIGDITPGKDKEEKYIERYTAMHYFSRADEHRYSDLYKELLASSHRYRNEYPKKNLREYDMLHSNAPSITTTSHLSTNGRRNFNIMFTQHQKSKNQGNSQGRKQAPETDGRITDHLCFKYNGHVQRSWY